jgi:hypothetical protein
MMKRWNNYENFQPYVAKTWQADLALANAKFRILGSHAIKLWDAVFWAVTQCNLYLRRLQTYRRNMSPPSSGLTKMDAIGSSETPVTTYTTTRLHSAVAIIDGILVVSFSS